MFPRKWRSVTHSLSYLKRISAIERIIGVSFHAMFADFRSLCICLSPFSVTYSYSKFVWAWRAYCTCACVDHHVGKKENHQCWQVAVKDEKADFLVEICRFCDFSRIYLLRKIIALRTVCRVCRLATFTVSYIDFSSPFTMLIH